MLDETTATIRHSKSRHIPPHFPPSPATYRKATKSFAPHADPAFLHLKHFKSIKSALVLSSATFPAAISLHTLARDTLSCVSRARRYWNAIDDDDDGALLCVYTCSGV
jgi:hypothetical protein